MVNQFRKHKTQHHKMRFVVSANQTIKLEFKENVNKIEIVTPKGRIIAFDNEPPTTCKQISKHWYAPDKTIAVELKFKCNDFLKYTLDKRSDKELVSIEQLNKYPLWRCIKWQIFENKTIFMFNFVRQAIMQYQVSDYIETILPPGFLGRNSDLEFKINMKGVFDVEQDVLEKVMETDGKEFWNGRSQANGETKPPPPYEDGNVKGNGK